MTRIVGAVIAGLATPRRGAAQVTAAALTDRLSLITSGGTNVLALSTPDGLVPVDSNGNVGSLTLANWSFLWEDPLIWRLAANTFVLALGLAVGSVLISALAGYALSRISFPGRKVFLGTTLILHAFPSVTLLVAIYFVLRWIGNIPILGHGLPLIGGFGYSLNPRTRTRAPAIGRDAQNFSGKTACRVLLTSYPQAYRPARRALAEPRP